MSWQLSLIEESREESGKWKQESGKVSFKHEESSRKVNREVSLIEESREETGKWKQEIRSYPECSVPWLVSSSVDCLFLVETGESRTPPGYIFGNIL